MLKDTKKPETEEKTWEGFEKFFATEVVEQSKRSAKRWFIAFVITLSAFFATNAYWIYVFNTYEYVDQYGDGVNSVNNGTQGDIVNEPASED